MKALLASLLVALPAAAQTPAPAPAPTADAPPKPRPVLNLKLEDADQHKPRVVFGAKDEGGKKDAPAELPGLGGRPSGSWERPASATYPPDTQVGPK